MKKLIEYVDLGLEVNELYIKLLSEPTMEETKELIKKIEADRKMLKEKL